MPFQTHAIQLIVDAYLAIIVSHVVGDVLVEREVKEVAACIEDMDYLVYLLPGLLPVHLAKVGLFQQVDLVFQLP